MNICTELVQNKRYDYAIKPCLLKRSQEYRVLATLRYLLPQEYSKMVTGESSDLQDCDSSVGIEVTAAVYRDDMKVASAFSNLHQSSSIAEMEKHKE